MTLVAYEVAYWSQRTHCVRCNAPVYIKFINNDLYLIDCDPKHYRHAREPRWRMFEEGIGVEHYLVCNALVPRTEDH